MTRRSLLGLLLIGILLTSCAAPPPTDEPTPDINATVAAAAQTLAASLFQTQTAIAPTATNTPLPTVTSLPTTTALTLPSPLASATQAQGVIFFSSPTPTGTFYTSTPSSSSLAVGCNNLRLIESFTEPAGTLTPGQEFTQYWQVENNGTCNWVYLYHLAHAGGNQMGGSPGRLSKVIPPGKWTTLAVGLKAPNSDGTHTGSWRFSDSGGTPFGATLPVSITVKKNPDPTGTPNLTQTVDVSVQQTATAAAQQTAVQGGVNTAVAATNACATATAAVPPVPCP
jgi:hypothetical protein